MDPLAPTYSGSLTAMRPEVSASERTVSDTVTSPPKKDTRAWQEAGTQAVSDRVSIGQQQDTPPEFRPYGPDGRTVPPSNSTIASTKDVSTPSTSPQAPDDPANKGAQSKNDAGRSASGAKHEDDPQIQQEIARLKAAEEKVKAHEAAHKAAGGSMTGPISYSYTRGPDGRNYVTGGEVPISVSPGKTPQETVSRMQQVIQAALAPADPSPQDRAVAAQAAAQLQEAQQQQAENSGSGTGKAPNTSSGAVTASSNDSNSAIPPGHGERDKGADGTDNSPRSTTDSADRTQPAGAHAADGFPGTSWRRSDSTAAVTAASGAHATAPQGARPRIDQQDITTPAGPYPTPDSLTGFTPARPLSYFA